MLITMNYARVICDKCGKEVQILLPGKPFETIKQCDCEKEEVVDGKRRKNTREV